MDAEKIRTNQRGYADSRFFFGCYPRFVSRYKDVSNYFENLGLINSTDSEGRTFDGTFDGDWLSIKEKAVFNYGISSTMDITRLSEVSKYTEEDLNNMPWADYLVAWKRYEKLADEKIKAMKQNT